MTTNRDLGYALHKLNFLLEKTVERQLQVDPGLGFSQFKILMGLEKHPEYTARQIADFLGQTEAAISRQIEHLVELGLVEAKTNDTNRRQRIITVTAHGKAITHQARSQLDVALEPMFGTLSAPQKVQLLAMLTTITGQVDHHRGGVTGFAKTSDHERTNESTKGYNVSTKS